MTLRVVVVVACVTGCTFDASGLGASGGSGSSGATSEETTGDATSTSEATTVDATSSEGTSTSAATEATTGATTTNATTTAGTTGPSTTTEMSTSTTGCDVMNEYYPDLDKDGFGAGDPVLACSAPPGTSPYDGDCDDADPNVHPGADELCDGGKVDENCNGLINEYSPLNETCGMCTQAYFNNTSHYYWFCKGAVGWDVARSACGNVNADLVTIGGDGENGFVRTLTGSYSVWLGGRDVDPNNDEAYTWIDGAALTYLNWVTNQPDDNDGCMLMLDDDGGKWRDTGCGNLTIGYVCEAALP